MRHKKCCGRVEQRTSSTTSRAMRDQWGCLLGVLGGPCRAADRPRTARPSITFAAGSSACSLAGVAKASYSRHSRSVTWLTAVRLSRLAPVASAPQWPAGTSTQPNASPGSLLYCEPRRAAWQEEASGLRRPRHSSSGIGSSVNAAVRVFPQGHRARRRHQHATSTMCLRPKEEGGEHPSSRRSRLLFANFAAGRNARALPSTHQKSGRSGPVSEKSSTPISITRELDERSDRQASRSRPIPWPSDRLRVGVAAR